METDEIVRLFQGGLSTARVHPLVDNPLASPVRRAIIPSVISVTRLGLCCYRGWATIHFLLFHLCSRYSTLHVMFVGHKRIIHCRKTQTNSNCPASKLQLLRLFGKGV